MFAAALPLFLAAALALPALVMQSLTAKEARFLCSRWMLAEVPWASGWLAAS